MKKFTLLFFMMLLGIIGVKAETVLWKGDATTANLDISAETAATADVKAGDVFVITVSSLNTADEHKFNMTYYDGSSSSWQNMSSCSWQSIDASGEYEYTLLEEDVSHVNGGFSLVHNNINVTKFSIRHPNRATSSTIWTGTLDASTDETQASQNLDFSAFSNAKDGDILRFSLTSNKSSYHQLWIKYLTGSGWAETADVLSTVNTDGNTDVTITSEMLEYLKGNVGSEAKGVRVYVKNNTLTSIQLVPTLNISDSDDPRCEAGTYNKVKLTRTLVLGWNTLCLPFTATSAELGLKEGDAIYKLADSGSTDEVIKLSSVSSIEANKPYFVYCVAERELTSSFSSLDVSFSKPDSYTYDNWTMTGNYTPNNSMEGKYIIYDDEVRLCGSGPYINGLRAYLVYDAGSSARSSVRFAFDNITGIKEIGKGQLTNDNEIYYDLMGRRVNYPTKGLYIKNGKKVILK